MSTKEDILNRKNAKQMALPEVVVTDQTAPMEKLKKVVPISEIEGNVEYLTTENEKGLTNRAVNAVKAAQQNSAPERLKHVVPIADVTDEVKPLSKDTAEGLQHRAMAAVRAARMNTTPERMKHVVPIADVPLKVDSYKETQSVSKGSEGNPYELPEVVVTAPAKGSRENPYELPEVEVVAARNNGTADSRGAQENARANVGAEPVKEENTAPVQTAAPAGGMENARVNPQPQKEEKNPYGPAEYDHNLPKEVAPYQEPQKKPMTYTDLINELYARDEEARKKEERKQRNRAIIAAVGDGISSLANLAATGYGATSAYDPKESLSKKAQEKYDKMLSEWKAEDERRKALLLKGYEFDAKADADKAKAATDAALEELKQNNWQKTFDANEAYREATLQNQKEAAEATEREKEAERKLRLQIATMQNNVQKEANKIREKTADINAQKKFASDYMGKPNVFLDNSGNQLLIYDRVWNSNMQQVFDAIVNEKMAGGSKDAQNRLNAQYKKYDTWQKKMDFVKQNWTKSPAAVQLMTEFAKVTPQSMLDSTYGANNNAAMPGVSNGENNKTPGVK